MAKVLEVKNLVKDFKNKRVLDDVSFSLEKGCVCGLLGPNGAGKTTTMKIIVGLLDRTSGDVLFDKGTVISYLQDVPKFYEFYSIYEYLCFLSNLRGEVDSKRIDEILELVGLNNYKNTIIKKLSRGLRQRVGIASAIINKPDILILDEPVSALDPIGRKEIFDLIGKLKGKMTIIFSSHILSDAEKICDQVIIISKGKILLDKSIDEISFTNNVLKIEFSNVDDLKIFANEYKKNVKINNNTIEIQQDNIDKLEQDVFKILIGKKISISSISIKKNTLEDIFISEVVGHE